MWFVAYFVFHSGGFLQRFCFIYKDVGQSCQTVWCLFCVIVYTCWDNKTRAISVWHMYLCALPHPQLGIWLQVNNSMVDRQYSLSFSANLMVHINLCVGICNQIKVLYHQQLYVSIIFQKYLRMIWKIRTASSQIIRS